MIGRLFTIAVAGAGLLAGGAEAQIKSPDCGALAKWIQASNFSERERLNPYVTTSFSKPVIGEGFTRLFGKPAKSLSQADVAAARQAVDGCEKAAARAKDRATAKQFAGLEAEIARNLGPVLAMIEKADATLDPAVDRLVAFPPGMDMLRVVVGIRHFLATGDDRGVSAVYGGHVDRRIEAEVKAVFTALRNLPGDTASKRLPAKIDPLYAPSRDVVLKEAQERLAAAPASVAGLRDLDRDLERTKTTLGKLIPAAELAPVDEAAAKRRMAIHDQLVAEGKGKIDAMPVSLSSLAMLSQSGARPLSAGLPPERVQELEKHADARKEVIADAVLKAGKDKLAEFPASFEGLAQLDGFQQSFRTQAGPQIGMARVQQFDGAMRNRVAELAKAAAPDFKKRLAALPETREGIATLDGLMQGEVARLARLDKADIIGKSFAEPAAARRADMLAAVEKEEKRLEAKALPGQSFATPNGMLKIEFRDRSRAYVTAPTGDMVEANWEQDGKRVIVRVPNSNMVLERQGGNLVGGGWVLRPVAAK
ncbi:hypothetical protein [Desertibaculum subflavum]|uniref:hypothetical protein n=1 Tax=Desertibaculum subflavum TaxID=2268458 RepID=UPI000E66C4BC